MQLKQMSIRHFLFSATTNTTTYGEMMSTQPWPATTATCHPTWTGKQWLCRIGVPVAFLVLVIGGPFEHLLLGWLYFLLRVAPRVSADSATAILGLLCAVAFVVGLHFAQRWLLSRGGLRESAKCALSFRSSAAVSLMILLLFVAGTALVGATHQLIWLASGRAGHPGDAEAESQPRLGSFLDAVQQAREAARRSQQRNNFKQLGLAVANVAWTINCFPPGGVMTDDGTLLHGWAIFLSGYAGYTVNRPFDFSKPWNQAPNDRIYQCGLPDFINPSIPGPYFDDQGYGLAHIAANSHVFPIQLVSINNPDSRNSGLEVWSRQFQQQQVAISYVTLTDGASQTIQLGTVGQQFKPWGHPANVRDPSTGIDHDPNGFGGPPGWHGAQFLMCDGSARFLSNKTDPKILQALATPAGGEQIPEE